MNKLILDSFLPYVHMQQVYNLVTLLPPPHDVLYVNSIQVGGRVEHVTVAFHLWKFIMHS